MLNLLLSDLHCLACTLCSDLILGLFLPSSVCCLSCSAPLNVMVQWNVSTQVCKFFLARSILFRLLLQGCVTGGLMSTGVAVLLR